MKHYIVSILFGLCLCQAVLGKPAPPPLPPYINYGVVSQSPVIDSPSFYNAGDFEIDTISSFSLTNLINVFGNGFSPLPFTTKDTLFFTNTGLMIGTNGFRFDTATSTSRHSASFFVNEGTLAGMDQEGFVYLYSVAGSKTFIPIPANSQPIASQLLVLATNIVNTGDMSVGDAGLLRMDGLNVTNSYASLAAGTIATVGFSAETTDPTGFQGQEDIAFTGSGQYFFDPSLNVYDLEWGITNGDLVDVSGLDLPFGLPPVVSGARGFGFGGFFFNSAANYSVNVFSNVVNVTNIYYDVVFVNTNFVGANLSAAVGISPPGLLQYIGPPAADFNAFENIVQFSEPVYDVITGQTVTNGVYLIDDGGALPSMSLSVNASVAGPYDRPNAFELTTVTPFDWFDATLEAEAFAGIYDPALIYTPGIFNNNMQAMEVSDYGAQIGHNPASISGSFSSLIASNSLNFFNLLNQVALPDPTNEPARIEITADNLDLTQTRLRAEGMLILNATNLTGLGTATQDWGEANVNVGVSNGLLTISNIFPTTFNRVRGDIYAQSATWQNIQTNQLNPPGNTNAATNVWHYHVLVVDQNLFGTFPSTIRNLKMTGSNAIVLQDNLNVINQAVFKTPNLSVTSTNFFSQNAQDFTPSSTPGLQNLFVAPSGLLGAFSTLDVGFNRNQGLGTPAGRNYIVNSIINYGQMISTAPLLQSTYIENQGQIVSDNGGSMVLAANVLSLGPTLDNLTNYIDSQTNALGLSVTNSTNFLFADRSIDLSAATIEASNSVIFAGVAAEGSLTLDATEALTDFVSGTPTTNTNSVIVNHWTVTGGFALPRKPATGDLFGTEIHTIATNFQQAIHVWAGTDLGASPAGFVNNEVIGRLVLDRQATNAVLRFSAAGAQNAMYVDFLEMTNFAFSQYRSNLVIDPNFKIYFADSNMDPEKLMDVYPGLIWVQNFAGPNSTQVVPYFDSSNICLMNAALAQSPEISFFNGVANADNQPYVLNNPSDPSQTYPCPGDEETALRSFLVSTPVPGGGKILNLLNININGQGSITPDIRASQLALGSSHTLTATAAKGWVFQNWSTIGLSGSVNADSRILPFTFVTNTVITANFMPNPFTLLQGSYNGLFFEAGGANPGSSGAFTLTLHPGGSFSGRLLMGSSTFNFTSQFSGAGGAQFQARSGAQSLTLNLHLDMTGQTGQINGDVRGASWDAVVSAEIAPTWTARNPSPLAGGYTMILPSETSTAGTPGGDGYAVGTVNKMGVLSMAGALADGATFSASAPVSQNGQWPFYAYSASGKDTLLGWVSVGNGLSGTNISWSKAAGKGPLYAAGFSSVLQLTGSPWLAPGKESAALALSNPTVVLSGGNLAEPLTNAVTLEDFLTYTGPNLTLTIHPANGSFSGSFTNPAGGAKQTIMGAVLQRNSRARGFFPGPNGSGAVLLESQ